MQLIDCSGNRDMQQSKSINRKCIKLLTEFNGKYIIYATGLICNVYNLSYL